MSSDQPYLHRIKVKVIKKYNPDYGDDRKCKCGHLYERHFDGYEDNRACGCKYCSCYTFEELRPDHCFAVFVEGVNNIIFKANDEDTATDKMYEIISKLPEDYNGPRYGVQECKWEDTFVVPIEYPQTDEWGWDDVDEI